MKTGIGMALTFAGGTPLIFSMRSPKELPYTAAMIVVLLVGVSICGFALRELHQLREQLEYCYWMICPCCRYDLDQTRPLGRCPECNDSYDAREMQQRWSRLLKGTPLNDLAGRRRWLGLLLNACALALWTCGAFAYAMLFVP